ncbi:MAG TPA: AAA family ATPase, partial [Thermoanaerobaculia bacterium]|nr:AAA family ATPase [Thermoanaerobaculia bacterium]
MLKLEKLEISGFKSFVEPVTLSFAGGITAIVGPNGCGKSNLSDAITWVLGEQSAKSLRGTRMEDVIFAGSEQRKALGMAEVMLHLRTDPSFAHSEEGRIAIGRRVFRSGESQYRLNGRTVRLKEIRDLLMDTGLGIRAYSVIEQGKVGMILSGKPQERRRLLEEAAGITRYKQRKQVAEVKLEESIANLLRLDDIIAEVERSLRSLKRQAAAARRYKQQEAEYRDLLARVLAGRWSGSRKRLAEVAGRLAEAQRREAALAAELSRLEAELAASRERGDELTSEMAERHQRHGELGATIEGRQQFLRSSRQRLAEIDERSGRSKHLAERRREEIAQHAEALAELAGRREAMEAELAAAADEVDRDEAQVTAAEERLRAAQTRVEESRRRLLAETAELNALRNRRHQGQIELEKAQYRRQHLERELAEHEAEVARAAEALEGARRTVAALGERIAERTAALEKVSQELKATLERENEASEKRRSLERQVSEADQRRRLLVELGRAFAERRARLAEALEAAGERPGADGGTAFLADRVKALDGWERSLDFFLSGLEHAVVLPSPAGVGDGTPGGGGRALELARRLAGGPGAAVIEPVAVGAPEILEMPVVDDPAVVLSLGEALELPEDVAAALPPAFLVEHGADAARLARRHPGIAFLSREGFWAAGGAVHVEAGEAGPGVLEREREIQALEREIPRLQGELDEVTVLIGKLVERRSALARDSNQRQGELARLRQESAVAEARTEDAAARHRRLGVERETLGVELEEVGREMARVAGDHEGVVVALAEAERRHAAVSTEGDAARQALETA